MNEVKFPEEWKTCTLDVIAKFIDYRGRTPKKTSKGVPLITAKNIRDGYINREPREYIAESEYANWMTRGIPKVGDVVITTEAPMGNVALVDLHEKFALAQRTICLQCYESELGSFLHYALRSSTFQKLLTLHATGTTVNGIKAATLKKLTIPLPPLAEQKIIVDKLANLLLRVEIAKVHLNRIPKILKAFRQSILTAAVSGKLTEEWRVVNNKPLGDIKSLASAGKVIAGQSPSKSEVNFEGKGEPYITGPEQWDGRQLLHHKWTEHPKRIAPEKSIFVTVKGAGVGTTFPGCYAAIGRDIYAFVPNEDMNYTYILFAIQASAKDVVLKAKGLIPGLTKSDIVDHGVYLPSINEQTEIVRRVEELLIFADSIEQKVNTALERVNNLSQSILAKAFRGELTAGWREDNPALISGDNSAEALLAKIKAEREIIEKQPKLKRTTVKNKTGSRMGKQIIKVAEALKQVGEPLSGQQLLVAAGYPSDSSVDQLEQFFLDIRDALAIERSIVKLERDDSSQDWFTLAKDSQK